jgi:excisionase family DNA binding protein
MTSDARFDAGGEVTGRNIAIEAPSNDRRVASAERLMLTVAQSAELLGLGRTTTYELVMRGTIESVHVGRRRLIPRRALDRFIERLLEAQSFDSLS